MDQFLTSNAAHFFWGLSAFVVFVVILIPLAVKPVLAAVDAREAKIREDLESAERVAIEAQKAKAQLEALIKANEGKISEMMAEARRDAEAHKAQMIEAGRADIEAIRVRALREIEAARHAAVISLRGEVAEIAVLVAEKAIRERFDAKKHEDVVAQAISAYEAKAK
jgi:F-type H+-transporting ATPase subunit b